MGPRSALPVATESAPVAALRRAREETNRQIAEAQGELARRQQAAAQAERNMAVLLGDLTAIDNAIGFLTAGTSAGGESS